MNIQTSIELFQKANRLIPGGVNSPVRAFTSVGGTPIFIHQAKGAYLFDEDGNSYIDYINSWGPMILGHANDMIIEALELAAKKSFSFGAPTRAEVDIADLIQKIVPNIEMIRFVNSGTEACMSALRVARGYTQKSKFIKFSGCYHGHADPFLVEAGSGVATLGIKKQTGVVQGVVQDTLVAEYNNIESVEQLFTEHPNEIAALILEPVAGNMGCIPPKKEFLHKLKNLCVLNKAVLIFDEVMTGFRLGVGGVQQLYGIEADLVTFGKIIGGGLPVGAFGGRREIMECVAPLGNVYQAGTLSGNPLAIAAGFTTLKQLHQNPYIYDHIGAMSTSLCNELKIIFDEKGIATCINQVGSMMSVHFTENQVVNFRSAAACDMVLFKKYFHHMLANGIYLPPSAYESWFIGNCITPSEVDKTINATRRFLN
jgi:glutamate-1-semialdehyde 2,1-aminomutase